MNSVLIQPVCQILDPEVDGDGTKRVEANILKLVTEYQNTKKREPELVKDIKSDPQAARSAHFISGIQHGPSSGQ